MPETNPEILKPYAQRVIVEFEELADKRDRLAAFLKTPDQSRQAVSREEWRLLRRQHAAMVIYADALAARIQIWAPPPTLERLGLTTPVTVAAG